MTFKVRPGSELEAEQKSLRVAKIIFGAITVILFCMTYFGLFDTNLYYFHQKASHGAHIFGIVSFALCGIAILAGEWISGKAKSDTLWYVIWIALFAFSIAVSCGFNFSDPVK